MIRHVLVLRRPYPARKLAVPPPSFEPVRRAPGWPVLGRRGWLLCLGLWAAACAGCHDTPAPALPDRTVRAPGPGADQYRTDPPPGAAALGPYAAAVQRAMTGASEARGQQIAGDPRLAQLASWVADASGENLSAPPYPVIDLYAHHLGLPEPTPHLLLLAEPDADALERQVVQEVSALMPRQHYTHFGAATTARQGAAIAVIALSFRQLELGPVPRVTQPDSALALHGTLGGGLHDAQLVVTYPDGTIFRSEPQPGTRIDFPLQTRGRGEHRVELLADSVEGIKVLANFPLYVGIAPVREVRVSAAGSRTPLNAAQLAARLLGLMNAERAHAGLDPLERSARLDAIARAHSEDMQKNSFVAHTSPTTGSAADRVAKAGVRTPLVLENIGRGYSADEIHRGLMESPGHRENMLNADATHVGIGVVIAPEEEQPAYLVTEVFARFAQPIDPRRASAQLLAAIARARSAHGHKPLQHDAALSELCERAAQRFFQDAALSKEQLVEQLNQEAAATHPRYAQLLGAAVLITAVEDAGTVGPWLDPKARAIALGLAQGTRSDTYENAILLVALVGY